jgi:hypothetical protein
MSFHLQFFQWAKALIGIAGELLRHDFPVLNDGMRA